MKLEITEDDKKFLLKLARDTIKSHFAENKNQEINLTNLSENLSELLKKLLNEKMGCFVTLHKNNSLRGCIGTLEPVYLLIDAIKKHAISSAFRDTRFEPLYEHELDFIKIEISILTKPEILNFKDSEDLKNKLIPNVHGVILSKGYYRSTFLPQVWEQLPDKQAFLEHLCQKAGMNKACWKQKDITVEIYKAYCFGEE